MSVSVFVSPFVWGVNVFCSSVKGLSENKNELERIACACLLCYYDIYRCIRQSVRVY